MGEQIALAHLHGVSAAQMKLRLGPLPLAKPTVRTHSPHIGHSEAYEHPWVHHHKGMRLWTL